MTLLLSLPAISSPLLDKIINYLKGAPNPVDSEYNVGRSILIVSYIMKYYSILM